MSTLTRYLAVMAERYGREPRRLTEYRQREQDRAAAIARHPAGKQLQPPTCQCCEPDPGEQP